MSRGAEQAAAMRAERDAIGTSYAISRLALVPRKPRSDRSGDRSTDAAVSAKRVGRPMAQTRAAELKSSIALNVGMKYGGIN